LGFKQWNASRKARFQERKAKRDEQAAERHAKRDEQDAKWREARAADNAEVKAEMAADKAEAKAEMAADKKAEVKAEMDQRAGPRRPGEGRLSEPKMNSGRRTCGPASRRKRSTTRPRRVNDGRKRF
jgi:hypothetical protein